jgi:tetratricopeptide (TPR) repeat protein
MSSAGAEPRLSLCVIARDEAAFIAGCLESARAFVDEMIVLDTGSRDATPSIARAHGARVSTFAWCDDFAAARNAALDQASGDWVLMLDADERLASASGPALRDLAASAPPTAHGYLATIENHRPERISEHAMPRFFRRFPDLRWFGAIHEELVCAPHGVPNWRRTQLLHDARLRIVHYGYAPDVFARRGKLQRNRAILERALADDPENPRVLYYLGLTQLQAGRNAEGIALLRRLLGAAPAALMTPAKEPLTGPNQVTATQPSSERVLPRSYIVQAYGAWLRTLIRSDAGPVVWSVAKRARAARAISPEAHEALAEYAEGQGAFHRARWHLLHALDPACPREVLRVWGVGGWRTRLQLARLDERLGWYRSALRQTELAYAEVPDEHRFELAGAAAYVALARLGEQRLGDVWLARAVAYAPSGPTDAPLPIDGPVSSTTSNGTSSAVGNGQ